MGGRKTRDGNKSLFNLLEGGAKNKPKPTNAKVAKRMATGPSGPGNNLLRGLEKAAGVPHQDLGNYSVARTAKLVSVAMAKREASAQKDLKYLGDRSVLQAAREGRAADRAADRAEFGPGRKVSAEQAAAESGARKQAGGGGGGGRGSGGGGGGKAQKRHPAGVPSGGRFA